MTSKVNHNWVKLIPAANDIIMVMMFSSNFFGELAHIVLMASLSGSSIVFTSSPHNQTICVGGEAVVNCGYTGHVSLVPILFLNQTPHLRSSPDIPGLPTDFIVPVNDSTSIRIEISPVGEEFIGSTTIACRFEPAVGTVDTITAILTIIG